MWQTGKAVKRQKGEEAKMRTCNDAQKYKGSREATRIETHKQRGKSPKWQRDKGTKAVKEDNLFTCLSKIIEDCGQSLSLFDMMRCLFI